MNEIERPNYYAILPAKIRYDIDLPHLAKLLYAEITSLTYKEGYCWATNKYFAELYNVTSGHISEVINMLKNKKYIDIKIEKNNNRTIFLPPLKSVGGYRKISRGATEKSVGVQITPININIKNNNKENGETNVPPHPSIKFGEDSVEYNLCLILIECIKENKSDYKQPKNLQNWAQTFDYMIRLDKRNVERIITVIEWAQHDSFWRTNILSADKLRSQFDKLELLIEEASYVDNYPELTDKVIEEYKTRYMYLNPEAYQEAWRIYFAKAANNIMKFHNESNLLVDKIIEYLWKCLHSQYENSGNSIFPSHVCSDNTWGVILPQYLNGIMPNFKKGKKND